MSSSNSPLTPVLSSLYSSLSRRLSLAAVQSLGELKSETFVPGVQDVKESELRALAALSPQKVPTGA
jgi:hypothetical protein